MKKIIVTVFLIFTATAVLADSVDKYNSFMKSLRLSQKQTAKINDIEKNYRYEAAQLRANIILRAMQAAQSGNSAGANSLESGFSEIQEDLIELQSQKEDEIASCLGLIKRFKYRNYCKRYTCY